MRLWFLVRAQNEDLLPIAGTGGAGGAAGVARRYRGRR